MIRTIKFDDNHSVEMSSNIGWLLTYRSQFGKDILPDLMPVIESLVTLVASLFDGSAEITMDEVIAKIDRDALSDLYLSLSNLEFTTIINIAWALAKTADDSIAAPEEWVKQFDIFPFDTLIVEMFRMIAESSISSKKLDEASEPDEDAEAINIDRLVIAATDRGLDLGAIRSMEVGQLVDFLTEWTNIHKDDFNFDKKEKHKVKRRKATQADWDALFG